jgi:hypothetical protein
MGIKDRIENRIEYRIEYWMEDRIEYRKSFVVQLSGYFRFKMNELNMNRITNFSRMESDCSIIEKNSTVSDFRTGTAVRYSVCM